MFILRLFSFAISFIISKSLFKSNRSLKKRKKIFQFLHSKLRKKWKKWKKKSFKNLIGFESKMFSLFCGFTSSTFYTYLTDLMNSKSNRKLISIMFHFIYFLQSDLQIILRITFCCSISQSVCIHLVLKRNHFYLSMFLFHLVKPSEVPFSDNYVNWSCYASQIFTLKFYFN